MLKEHGEMEVAIFSLWPLDATAMENHISYIFPSNILVELLFSAWLGFLNSCFIHQCLVLYSVLARVSELLVIQTLQNSFCVINYVTRNVL